MAGIRIADIPQEYRSLHDLRDIVEIIDQDQIYGEYDSHGVLTVSEANNIFDFFPSTRGVTASDLVGLSRGYSSPIFLEMTVEEIIDVALFLNANLPSFHLDLSSELYTGSKHVSDRGEQSAGVYADSESEEVKEDKELLDAEKKDEIDARFDAEIDIEEEVQELDPDMAETVLGDEPIPETDDEIGDLIRCISAEVDHDKLEKTGDVVELHYD